MKLKKIAALAAFGCAALMVSCGGSNIESAAKKATVKSSMDSLSYGYGYMMGKQVLEGVEQDPFMKDSLNKEAFIKGLVAAIYKDSTINEDTLRNQMNKLAQALQKNMDAKASNDFAPIAKKYQAQGFQDMGKIFADYDGPTVYKKQLVAGNGDSIKATDFVLIDYVGSLEKTGIVFDSTSAESGPRLFPVGRVIPGFTQALCSMKVGEKATYLIPSKLGYGPQGAGDKIPANSDLIFTIEVKKVLHSEQEAQKYYEQMQKDAEKKAKAAGAAKK